MPIVYVKFNVSIHGLEIRDNEALVFLKGEII
jgi:hypothetical protein